MRAASAANAIAVRRMPPAPARMAIKPGAATKRSENAECQMRGAEESKGPISDHPSNTGSGWMYLAR